MAKRTEPLVEFDIKVEHAEFRMGGVQRLQVTPKEARRVLDDLRSYFAQHLVESPPRYHGIELTDEQWDKLEANVRKARAKKK